MTDAVSRLPKSRLNRALVGSLLVHGLLLSLTFGGQGFKLPEWTPPWQAAPIEPDLHVVLQPVPESLSPPEPDNPAAMVAPRPSTVADDDAEVEQAPVAGLPLMTVERSSAHWQVPAASAPQDAAVAALPAASAPAVERLRRLRDEPSPRNDARARERDNEKALAELEDARQAMTPVAPVARLSAASAPAVEAVRRAGESLRIRGERAKADRGDELAQLDRARQAMTPVVAVATLSAASAPEPEALRRTADQLRPRSESRSAELAQLDGVRQVAQQRVQQLQELRQAAERQELARQEAARQDAARQEAARQEAARQQAAQAEAAKLEVERREAARVAGLKQEGLRLEAARLAAAQAQAQAENEQREARLRAIGRQLDEEAARRDAERQRPDWTPARRGRLYSRTDANAELAHYGELWARKIQFNQTFDLVRDAVAQPHTDPIVTVAVRSNGSVEAITFVRSSGVPALDEAIRRVVHSQENYPAFPAALQRDFDVVEIRRTWRFDISIRLD
nr:TonB C-terminal domain-containing protein [Pelomonas sp. P8]